MTTINAEQLRSLAKAIFVSVGTPEDIATYMAGSLVECDLMGHPSHGVIRIPSYVERVENGRVKADGRPEIWRETRSTAVVKANWGFGQLAASFGADVAIRKAQECDIAAVTVVECNHQGRLGEFSAKIARAGMVGMVVTGGFGVPFDIVAPFGGSRRVLGTNPYSFAVPAGRHEPFMADFATSVVPEGKLRVAEAKGERLPEGIVIDSEGRPSTDPSIDLKGGAILPFGGHKGYALGLLADLLGSLLSGAEKLDKPPYTYGTFLMALRIEAFRPLAEFTQAVDRRFDEVKAVPPAPGFSEVLIPGEPEARSKARISKEGITLAQETWDKLTTIATQRGVDVEAVLG